MRSLTPAPSLYDVAFTLLRVPPSTVAWRAQCCEAVNAFACCLCLILLGGPILIAVGATILAAANKDARGRNIGGEGRGGYLSRRRWG